MYEKKEALKPKKKLTRIERLVRCAFIELLKEKSFDQIKVSDIIKKADVSRSAFYAHYTDKYDLAEQLETELMEGFQQRMMRIQQAGLKSIFMNVDSAGELMMEYFVYIQSERELWDLFMRGRGSSDFAQRFTHVIYDQFAKTAKKWDDPQDTAIPITIGLTMGAWSYVGVISYWLETGMKESPAEMGVYLATYWNRYKAWLNKQE